MGARYGRSLLDKLKLLILGLLSSFPTTFKRLRNEIKRYLLVLYPKVMVRVCELDFNLIDDDSLLIVSPQHEQWMERYLKPEKGDYFLDVGAHIGKYSLQAAKKIGNNGRVIAVEPTPVTFKILKQNIRINNLRNIIPLRIAGWNKECVLQLFLVDNYSCNNILGDRYSIDNVSIKARRLDNVLNELGVGRLDWIKIDVERAEYEVLQGLKNSLKNYNPRVIVEIWNKNKEKIFKFMEKNDYVARLLLENPDGGYYIFKKEM